MDWRRTTDPTRLCPEWVAVPYDEASADLSTLGDSAGVVQRRLATARRSKRPKEEVAELEAAVEKTAAAYEEQSRVVCTYHVFVLRRAHGYCVLRGDTGSKIHALEPTLEKAQRAAEKLIGGGR